MCLLFDLRILSLWIHTDRWLMEKKMGAYIMKGEATGAHLSTLGLLEPATHPDDGTPTAWDDTWPIRLHSFLRLSFADVYLQK